MNTTSSPARMFCEACGNQVMPALIRCRDCGTPLPRIKTPASGHFSISSTDVGHQTSARIKRGEPLLKETPASPASHDDVTKRRRARPTQSAVPRQQPVRTPNRAVSAEFASAQAAALLFKRKPRPSVKKLLAGFQPGSIVEHWCDISTFAKTASSGVLLLLVGVVFGFAGLLPSGLLGSGSAAPVLRGNVAHAAFSSDGQQVAVARTRGLLEIYMRSEQAPPQQIPLSCQAVSFTPHPQLLLLASGKELLTWKGETPDAPPQSIAKFNAAIQFMTSTPDFKFAATWTTDGVVRIWNLTTMKEYQSLHIAVPQNQVIALSPDARMIVSGTQEGTVIVWDASSRAKLSEIPGLKGSVTALAFSRDGKRLAAGTKNGQYYVWEYATGKTLSEWNDPGAVRFLWVDMSRELVIAVSGLSNLKRWNWTDGSSTAFPTTDAESYDMLINSPDGKTIVVAGKNDSPVWLFDVEKGTLVETWDAEP